MSLLRMVVLCAVFVACARITSPAQGQEAGAAKQPASSPVESVAAVVNGEHITESEVAAVVQQQLRGRSVSDEAGQEIRQLVIRYLIDGRLVEQSLVREKFEVDGKEVDAVMQQIRSSVAASGVPFEEAIKRQGQTETSLRARLTGQLRFQKFADARLTDDKLADYFTTHKSEFDGSEVRASHVLIKLERTASADDKKAALAKIQSIRTEIVGGLDFAEAARKYSQCPSSKEGGDLGFFPRHDGMVEPFAAAAFALKTGDLSDPVETQFGLHLIKLTDRKQGDKKLDEVRDEVKSVLIRDLWQQTVTEQRKDAKIQVPAPEGKASVPKQTE